MTESEWFSCTNPHDMLAYLKPDKAGLFASALARFGLGTPKASTRKFMLFACACCQRLWPLLPNAECREAIDCAERYAEGLLGKRAFQQAAELARVACLTALQPHKAAGGWLAAAQAKAAEAVTRALNADDPAGAADEVAVCAKEAVRAWSNRSPGALAANVMVMPGQARQAPNPDAAWIAEGIAQCDLLRDLFGNPFHREVLDASCRTPQAIASATSIFKERDFASVPKLADILQQSGCTSQDLLKHFRDRKEHARGCWALDLVLRKC